MTTLDEFIIDRIQDYPLPDGPVERIKLLATELVLGVHNGFWSSHLQTIQSDTMGGEFVPMEDDLREYMCQRWDDIHIGRKRHLLLGHGYLEDFYDVEGSHSYRLSHSAFALLTEAPPYGVFISYTHKESSAFALLLVTKLKHHGIQPFCDMSLAPGEEWHPELEKQIKECEHFIVLIGKETRKSEATLKEVTWALKENKIIIPIWHNGFQFNTDEWEDIDCVVVSAIQRKHAVIVQKESAAGYNAAIVELLTNRFGITP